MSDKNILVYINSISKSSINSIRAYSKKKQKTFRLMLLRDYKLKTKSVDGDVDLVIDVDFTNPSKIATALLPFQDQLLTITCRSEANISHLIQVIPHVPYLQTPTTESLRWATDKYEMRKRFKIFDSKQTPKFTRVQNTSKKEMSRVVQKVGFPMIIKPANLSSSALVSICFYQEELEKTLKDTFKKAKSTYKKNGIIGDFCIISEEYMDGDMYSIDVYINSVGDIFYCPIVKVITGKNIGHDDFYNYLRITPAPIKKESLQKAHHCAFVGVKALGLRNTTAHVELMRIDDDWKLIEIGPRIGGFRHLLHGLSCDIDHGLNDILIRMSKKPIIPKKCKGFAASMRYYTDTEGIIVKMRGVQKIKNLSSYHSLNIKLKIGERTCFAKNGGRGIFDLTLYNTNRSKLLADIRRVEKMVDIEIEKSRTKQVKGKVFNKKVIKNKQ